MHLRDNKPFCSWLLLNIAAIIRNSCQRTAKQILLLLSDVSKINVTWFCCASFFLQNLLYVRTHLQRIYYNLDLFQQRWTQQTNQRCQCAFAIQNFNPLNAELNPIRHLLALVGARHIVHVSRIRVKSSCAAHKIDWLSKRLWHWLFRVRRLCSPLLVARGIMWYWLAQLFGSSSRWPRLDAVRCQYKDRLCSYICNDLWCDRYYVLTNKGVGLLMIT